MSVNQLDRQQMPVGPRIGHSLGTIVLGAILVLGGLVWILDVLDLVSISVGVVLPIALIMVGVALLAGSLSGSQGGLVAVGIVLTVLLTGAAIVDVPLTAGVGDRTVAPVRVLDLPDSYRLLTGNLKVDLTDLDLPNGVTTVQARVGIGELAIDVPAGTAVEVHWKVSAGNVHVIDVSQDGTSLDDHMRTPGYENAAKKLVVEASVGLGDIHVRQP